MNVYQIRQLLRTGSSIFDLELRVGYYARVSTDKEEQKNSIEHQKKYFEDFIAKHPKWTLIRGYVDDGISGLHTNKRENFHNMLEDSKNGFVDLVLTKEITRFARNTLDSIMYTRQMLNYGTCIWFINDNINTIDEDSELRLTIMSGIAQDEVRKLSSRVKFGHAQSIKNGVVLGNSWFYGYDKKDGKLTINEEEAKMIRKIFELYATGEWSTHTLERYLYESGYRNHNGEKILNRTIQSIIRNPKYKGYFCGGKVKIVDMFTKKQEFLPKSEWVMYKDDGNTVPAIVSEEIWDAANKIYQQRSEVVKSRKTSIKSADNLFTGKIVCGHDGHHYWLKERIVGGKLNAQWRCSKKLKEGAQSCPSFSANEQDLLFMLADILSEDIGDISDVAEEYMTFYKNAVNANSDDSKNTAEALNQKLQAEEKKKNKLLDLLLSDLIDANDFKIKSNDINKNIKIIQEKIEQLSRIDDDNKLISQQFKQIENTIEKYTKIDSSAINRKVIEELVDKIVINPISKTEAQILFYLNNHGIYDRKYDKKMFRSDNTVFKVIPERHVVFTRKCVSHFNHEVKFTYHYTLVL